MEGSQSVIELEGKDHL